MYVPRKFSMSDDEVADALREARLAYLTTPDRDGGATAVTPLPMLYDDTGHRLLGHVARANPHWRSASPEVETVAIFPGPDAYISPTFYATKAETGKTVPTWNYEVIAVYGRLHVVDDPDWLREQVTALSERHERDRTEPWSVSDAPADYVTDQLRAIVGVEVAITRWEGKAKLSQNQPARNRDGVIAGLSVSERRGDRDVAERMIAEPGLPAPGA
ncbi:FMN-binding negative transcriptional regulator [Gordonia sp. CPCC 206044]|uniref:FMN-binding negative transcriptional regulator n=1 Tax=Gordonia sp. CPCC 206044 TaxID=3140793 RepID=UPI003AF36462